MRKFAISLILAALVLLAASPADAQSPENEAMARKVAQSLKDSGRLKNYRVGVKYQDGVAWLLGTVTDRDQMEIAEAVASRTDGVIQVVNKLEIAEQAEAPLSRPAPQTDVTLAVAPLDDQTSAVPARVASATVERRAAQQLGPQPRLAPIPQPASAGMRTASSQHISHALATAGGPVPMGYSPQAMARQVSHDHPAMPGHAWPAYAAYPNYAALTYPQQYSAAAWPYIGPFYPYPQVPLGWRKVTLEWDDGWWFLDFQE